MYTPFEIMLGRKAILPIDVNEGSVNAEQPHSCDFERTMEDF